MRTTLTLLLILPALALALEAPRDDEKRGWFWYEEPPKEVDEEEAKETIAKRKPLPRPDREEMMKMHPDDIQALVSAHRKQAVWRPTPENVMDYYTVQDVARRKALAFTAVSATVMLENSELNVAKDYPVTNQGRQVAFTQRSASIDKALNQYRNAFGLVFFTSPNCPYCEVQRRTTALFQDRVGWPVTEIDITKNSAAAARFGIEFTPTLILAKRGSKEWMPVAVGVETLPGMKENIYRAVRLINGEIAPEQFYTMDYQKGGTFDPLSTSTGAQQ